MPLQLGPKLKKFGKPCSGVQASYCLALLPQNGQCKRSQSNVRPVTLKNWRWQFGKCFAASVAVLY